MSNYKVYFNKKDNIKDVLNKRIKYNLKYTPFDVSGWDVSNVIGMKRMFYNCYGFKGKGLDNWDVSNVKDMGGIFDGCSLIENNPSWYKE